MVEKKEGQRRNNGYESSERSWRKTKHLASFQILKKVFHSMARLF